MVIYFLLSPETNRIKIGHTNNIRTRISSIKGGSPVRLKLIKSINYDKIIEKKLHNKFKKDHIKGEWFYFSNKIRNFLLYEPLSEDLLDIKPNEIKIILDDFEKTKIKSFLDNFKKFIKKEIKKNNLILDADNKYYAYTSNNHEDYKRRFNERSGMKSFVEKIQKGLSNEEASLIEYTLARPFLANGVKCKPMGIIKIYPEFLNEVKKEEIEGKDLVMDIDEVLGSYGAPPNEDGME